MDYEVFVLGGTPVTVAHLTIAGVALALVLLATIIVIITRSSRQRTEEAAQAATDALRTSFNQQIAERDTRLREAAERLDDQFTRITQLEAAKATLETRLIEQARNNEAAEKRNAQALEEMTQRFKAISGEILTQHGETFSRQNREQVDLLLKPLREKITQFHEGLLKDRAEMGERIKALAESNLQITTEAHNLTRALKGSAQAQGAWGEMILSTILERSGLREGEQYRMQQSHTAEGGGRLRTDVEILMPNEDVLIIDSKVSLTAFETYTNASEDHDRQASLKAHIDSIRTHIRTLSDKEYQRHTGSGLDYVVMFVPIEAALGAAVAADRDLIEFGITRGVMLTTPTTLMTILRTVRNLWDVEKRHQNAEEIASRAGKLYDKVEGFLANMDKIETYLDRAKQSYSDARSQLSEGPGNVLRQVEMLRELGAKTNKQLPPKWSVDVDTEADEPPRTLDVPASDKSEREVSE